MAMRERQIEAKFKFELDSKSLGGWVGFFFIFFPPLINLMNNSFQVYLRVVESSTSWSGVFRIGFTSCNPSSFSGVLPKYACPGELATSLASLFFCIWCRFSWMPSVFCLGFGLPALGDNFLRRWVSRAWLQVAAGRWRHNGTPSFFYGLLLLFSDGLSPSLLFFLWVLD